MPSSFGGGFTSTVPLQNQLHHKSSRSKISISGGFSNGLDNLIKRVPSIKPNAGWLFKQKQYFNYTNLNEDECIDIYREPMNVYLKDLGGRYLRSDKNKMEFINTRDANTCAWKIITDDNMSSAWIKKYDALITKKPAAYFTKPAWKNKWCYQGDTHRHNYGFMGYTDTALECANKLREAHSNGSMKPCASIVCNINKKMNNYRYPKDDVKVPISNYLTHFGWKNTNKKCYWVWVAPDEKGNECEKHLKENSHHNFYRLENID